MLLCDQVASKKLFLLILFLTACQSKKSPPSSSSLYETYWETLLKNHPVWATRIGVNRYNSWLGDFSSQGFLEKRKIYANLLRKIKQKKEGNLKHEELINNELLRFHLTSQIEEIDHKFYLMPLNITGNFYLEFVDLVRHTPFHTKKDYLNYIARLKDFQRITKESIERMKEGIYLGYKPPQLIFAGYEKRINSIIQSLHSGPLAQPFNTYPATIAEDDQHKITQLGQQALRDYTLPAYQNFLLFWKHQYYPHLRKTLGISHLPHGKQKYQFLIKKVTSLDLSPKEIHQLGLKSVHKIQSKMQQILQQEGFQGNFIDYATFLKQDPDSFAKTSDELIQRIDGHLKKVNVLLPKLFKTLPSSSLEVREVPDQQVSLRSTAYYVPPERIGQPGAYYINTKNLKDFPLYSLESLSLHEAVPGHHLQQALQLELSHRPMFVRHYASAAFIEGWGLYAESLAQDLGFDNNPRSEFGRLSFELLRANRLVVDTGLHAFNWTYKQAFQFMQENSTLSKQLIIQEIHRYLSRPAQSLSYKIGQLTIQELRQESIQRLGPKFDIREFHDVVLRNGAVPLKILKQEVHSYWQQHSNNQQ